MVHLLLQLWKEMILSRKRNTRSSENINNQRPSARRELKTRLFSSKSSLTTLPQVFRILKVAIHKHLCKPENENLQGRILANEENVEFGLFEKYYKS